MFNRLLNWVSDRITEGTSEEFLLNRYDIKDNWIFREYKKIEEIEYY